MEFIDPCEVSRCGRLFAVRAPNTRIRVPWSARCALALWGLPRAHLGSFPPESSSGPRFPGGFQPDSPFPGRPGVAEYGSVRCVRQAAAGCGKLRQARALLCVLACVAGGALPFLCWRRDGALSRFGKKKSHRPGPPGRGHGGLLRGLRGGAPGRAPHGGAGRHRGLAGGAQKRAPPAPGGRERGTHRKKERSEDQNRAARRLSEVRLRPFGRGRGERRPAAPCREDLSMCAPGPGFLQACQGASLPGDPRAPAPRPPAGAQKRRAGSSSSSVEGVSRGGGAPADAVVRESGPRQIPGWGSARQTKRITKPANLREREGGPSADSFHHLPGRGSVPALCAGRWVWWCSSAQRCLRLL